MNYHVRQSKVRQIAVSQGYRSGFELEIANELNRLQAPFEYESERFTYYMPVRNCKCSECGSPNVLSEHHYTPDFKVGDIYFEAKGRLTAKDKKKMIAVKAYNPDKHIVFIFQDYKRKLTRKSKKTYAMWAEENGFEWMSIINLKHIKHD